MAPPQRSLVLDANILIRAILGKRVRELIYKHANSVMFFTPEVAYADARRYLPSLLEKRQIDAETALVVLDELEGIVRAVEEDTYAFVRDDAIARIEQRDPDDWTVLATAMVMHCPIWTEDQDFFGAGVATWTTDRVEIYLSAEE